jgi:site-specific DNA recombinase
MAMANRKQPPATARDGKPTTERVAVYARVSTEMQAEEGLSIAAQLTEMREFVAARGWTVVSEFVDAGITGQTLDRPGLQSLLTAAEQDAFDIVIVHELSRLSRSSVYDTFSIFDQLGRWKVGFASVKEPQFDLANPTGRFLLTIIAAINQYYIDILRMHTKKAKRQRAREGLYNSSITPYGYAHGGSPRVPPVIVEAEAQVVRFMFERYVTGRFSFAEIAEMVNDQGWRTRADRRFSKDTVTDMIRNPFYAGKVMYKESRRGDVGEMFEGQHAPIITEEVWDASVRVRQRHQHRSRILQAVSRPYLLSQLARCHICGRSLRAQGLKSGGYYREMSYERGYDDCPNSRLGTRADALHAQVGAIVRLLELPTDWQAELTQLLGADDEVTTLANRRARLTAERRRLKESYLRGDFDEDEDLYRRALERIRRELEQLPSEDDMGQIKQAAVLLDALSEVWDDADVGDQRDLTHLMLREVQVDVAQGRVRLLYPTAPFVPLFRKIPLLAEREMGSFAPVWTPELARQFALPTLAAQAEPLDRLVVAPFLPVWPWPSVPHARISPALSVILKARRAAGLEQGRVVAVAHPDVPAVELDRRKWPAVTLQTLSLAAALALPADSLACLDTPLAVQNQARLDELVGEVYTVLEPSGYWHFVDLMPSSMPAHWVFTYFPEAWAYVRNTAWTPHKLYTGLRRAGFGAVLQEHTFYQPLSLAAISAIAQRREGILAALADEAYQKGLARLAAALVGADAQTLIGSEVTLVEVAAVKDEQPRPKRRKRPFDAPADVAPEAEAAETP